MLYDKREAAKWLAVTENQSVGPAQFKRFCDEFRLDGKVGDPDVGVMYWAKIVERSSGKTLFDGGAATRGSVAAHAIRHVLMDVAGVISFRAHSLVCHIGIGDWLGKDVRVDGLAWAVIGVCRWSLASAPIVLQRDGGRLMKVTKCEFAKLTRDREP